MAKAIKQYGTSERNVKSDSGNKATAVEVEDFHTNSDVDLRAEALHHTLGAAPSQASPGNHTHNGGDSSLILDGMVITGSRATDTWRLSVNNMLVRLGAEDSSTP